MQAANSSRLAPTESWSQGVAKESSAFAKKMGLSPPAPASIAPVSLRIIRISHQPNLFAGLNIAGLPLLAANVSGQYPRLAFISIDYDAAGDQRFRAALVPPINGRHPTYLRGAVPAGQRRAIACSIEKPSIETVRHWLAVQTQAVKHWHKQLGLPARQPSLLPEEAIGYYLRHADSLTEFTLALFTRCVTEMFGVEMLTVPASKLLPHISDDTNDLVRLLLSRTPSCANSLAWRICGQCYQRCPAEARIAGKLVVLRWQCVLCKRQDEEALDWTLTVPSAAGMIPVFAPQITLCDMIDFYLSRATSVSYAGSVAHMLRSRALAQKVGIRVSAEFIWEPAHLGIVNNAAASADLWDTGKYSAYIYGSLFSRSDLQRLILHSAGGRQKMQR